MRVPGWCTECHKIKRVRVTPVGMTALAAGGAASGICSECQDKQDEGRGSRGIVQ